MTGLLGKIAIVTGVSRQQGIGTAIVRALAGGGAHVFFTHWRSYDRSQFYGADEQWPQQLEAELAELGVQAASMELDISADGAAKKLFDEVQQVFGDSANVLVNNATYCEDASYTQLTPELIDRHCAVNVRGTMLLSAEFAKRARVPQGRSGAIVNMVSGQAKGPMPGNLAYAATKGAVQAFSLSLSAELAPLQITVNAVDPGPTDSGWMDDGLREALLPSFPMGRIGVPADAARLVAFLASDEACWMTGQLIHSDGGFR